MNQWISINEALPKFGETVIVSVCGTSPYVQLAILESTTTSGSGTSLLWREEGTWDYINPSILFWMPLPEPATIPEP